MIRDLLGVLLEVYYMIFQNLPAEIRNNIESNNTIHISSEVIVDNKEEENRLTKLWTIKILKFKVNITWGIMITLFNSDTKMNILLYSVALNLDLAI